MGDYNADLGNLFNKTISKPPSTRGHELYIYLIDYNLFLINFLESMSSPSYTFRSANGQSSIDFNCIQNEMKAYIVLHYIRK